MYDKRIDLDEVKEFIDKCGPDTKVYLGCDSERLRMNGVWYADYITVIVVHVDGRHGCKVFGQIIRERDYDQQKNKPRMRLMTECYKLAELYLELAPMIEDVEIECHLDINPNKLYNSSIVINEAVGYIRGVCGVTPKVKPEAFCASYCADRYKSFMQ
jgi:predicted RNase H-related nuclease YkuK (DUF458 family)